MSKYLLGGKYGVNKLGTKAKPIEKLEDNYLEWWLNNCATGTEDYRLVEQEWIRRKQQT